MLTASDFAILSAQAVIYTPDSLAFSVPNLLATVLGKYAELYDGDVQAISLPESAPPELPRVILQSKDKILGLEASPSRINSFLTNSILAKKSLEEVAITCTDVLEHYAKATEAKINRLALVITWIYETENSARLLVEKFCKPELQATIFSQSQSFEVHSYEKTTLGGFSTNVWMRCKTAELNTSDDSKRIITVEQDINTLVEEETQAYTIQEISEYFQVVLPEINRLIQLYFPNPN